MAKIQRQKLSNTSAQVVVLRDGRRLAYNEYGAPDGRPAFYFHGGPGLRLEGAAFDQAGSDVAFSS